MAAGELFLGVDGGGTQSRARLADRVGRILGEGIAGPANIRLGLEASLAAVLEATRQCLAEAGLGTEALGRTIACLALAGATEPVELAAARARRLPFRHTLITTDARAACIGAHRGRDGGVIIAGTGSVGWAILGGKEYRVGGWGLVLSDEGSGAWLGREAMRRVLWAHDGRIAWSGLLTRLFDTFGSDPHAIVRWAAGAKPADFGRLAPVVVEHLARDDPAAIVLLRQAAQQADSLAVRLVSLGAERLALVGGLAPHIEPRLADDTRRHLVPPEGDALVGALELARTEANHLGRERVA
ncbi:MAG TPA: BadF/BadG/BcrA/BcrD ATPase family protein [Stellaceae bacterium]|nr:BadF/BadG/BcrA/BcrD ATPase family protein [Stellaceae bacterium]